MPKSKHLVAHEFIRYISLLYMSYISSIWLGRKHAFFFIPTCCNRHLVIPLTIISTARNPTYNIYFTLSVNTLLAIPVHWIFTC